MALFLFDNTPEVACQVTENPDSVACGSSTAGAQSQNSQQAGDGAVCGPDLNVDHPAFETKESDLNSVKLSCTHQGFAGDTTVLHSWDQPSNCRPVHLLL